MNALFAGMPAITLTEAAKARLDTISFFAVGFFIAAFGVKWAWNVIAETFPKLPILSYRQSLALVLVNSLFLYVILTMISGARELMTPGAWTRSGATYDLLPPESAPSIWLDSGRKQALENLRDALWDYAEQHHGLLPPTKDADHIPEALWFGIHPHRDKYLYRASERPGRGNGVVAYEPESYGKSRYVLRADGSVKKVSREEMHSIVRGLQ
jgi:hypothetical protein